MIPLKKNPSTTTGEREKYATYLHDGRTDLSYPDQRYYATGTGRFMTADPAGDGLNWYAYTGGDPVNRSDPRGLSCEDIEASVAAKGGSTSGCVDLPSGVTFGQILQAAQSCPPGHVCAEMPPGVDPIVELYLRWYMSAAASGSGSALFGSGAAAELPSLSRPLDLARSLRESVTNKELNECEALTVMATDHAYYLSSFTGTVGGYFPLAFATLVNSTDASVVRFNNFAKSAEGSLLGLSQIPGVPNGTGLGTNGAGFLPGYHDSLVVSDQTHHFAAFFLMGYSAGGVIGQVGAILRDLYPWNAGDVALGLRAAQIGANLRSGTINMTQVAGEIYKLCQ